MFSLTYMLSERRRRRGRTVLTALGLALAVGPLKAIGWPQRRVVGLVAGAAGGLRAARLRPADALRDID
jgi:hypothetical protein